MARKKKEMEAADTVIETVDFEEMEAFCRRYGETVVEYGWADSGEDGEGGNPIPVREEVGGFRVPFDEQVGGAPRRFLVTVDKYPIFGGEYVAIAVVDGRILRNQYLNGEEEAREWCRWAMTDPFNTEPPFAQGMSWRNSFLEYADRKMGRLWALRRKARMLFRLALAG